MMTYSFNSQQLNSNF